MSTSSDNFCLKAATKCSSNLNKCLQDTREKVTAARTKRKGEITAHKQLTAKVKNSLFTMWERLSGQLEANSVQLTGALKVKVPGMQGSLKDFLETSDKSNEHFKDLLLEDPNKYFAAMETMLDNKKQEMEQENSTIIAKVKEEYDISVQKYNANRDYLKNLAKNCENNLQKAIGQVNQQMAEQAKEAQKQAKIAAGGCQWRDDIATLSPSSGRSVCDMVKSSSAADAGANPTMVHINNVKENFKSVCENVPEDSAEPEVIFSRTSTESAKEICAKSDWSGSIACKRFDSVDRTPASSCEYKDIKEDLIGDSNSKKLICIDGKKSKIVDNQIAADQFIEKTGTTTDGKSSGSPYLCYTVQDINLITLRETNIYQSHLEQNGCDGGESRSNKDIAAAQVKLEYMKWSYTEQAQSMIENTPGCNEVYNSQFDPSLHQIQSPQNPGNIYNGLNT